jgi:hypothetical protein
VTPWEVVLPPQITAWTTNLITITNNGTAMVTLSNPKISDSRAKIELKTIVPGRSFLLVAIFPPGFKLSPGQTIPLSVSSDNATRRSITVSVRQESTEPQPAPLRPPIHHM